MLGRRVPPPPPSLARISSPATQAVLPSASTPPRRSSPAPTNEARLSFGSTSSAERLEARIPPANDIPDVSDLGFDLIVSSVEPRRIVRSRPLTIKFRLSVFSSPLVQPKASLGRTRRIRLIAQHVSWVAETSPLPKSLVSAEHEGGRENTRRSGTTFPAPVAYFASSHVSIPTIPSAPPSLGPSATSLALPPAPRAPLPSPEIVRLGSSLVELGVLTVPLAEADPAGSTTLDFELKYLANTAASGLYRVGGLRILVIADEDEGHQKEQASADEIHESIAERHAAVVLEVPTVAEIWVASTAIGSQQ